MAILVTGGAGYIGSHTCIELLQKCHDIVVIDNFSNSKQEALRRVSRITGKTFPIYAVDLLQKRDIQKVFAAHPIDAVVHFAGLKAVGESALFPLRYFQNNVTGTVNLCHVMMEFNVKRLVFSSSATVYGATGQMPLREDAAVHAINPYGRTKLMIEEILADVYAANPDWSIVLLRYFNPIGAHESGEIGEDPNGVPNNLLPYMAQVAIGNRQQLSIYGGDYETKDGTGVRDYIHVVDLATGHLKALERTVHIPGVHTYNLGTGNGYSVLEMVAAFEGASGRSIPYIITNRRPGDAAVCYADPRKAKQELGWQAMRGVERMCMDTWRWQVKNPHGYERSRISAKHLSHPLSELSLQK